MSTTINREPALLFSSIAALVVALAGVFDIVIEANTVETVLLAVVPLVAGLLTRSKVSPVNPTV